MNMNTPQGLACKDCRYEIAGRCHRFPPQMVLWPDGHQEPISYMPYKTFPFVDREDWCGEFTK